MNTNIGKNYLRAINEAVEVARKEIGEYALSLLDSSTKLIGIKYDNDTVILQSQHKSVKTDLLNLVYDKETTRLIRATPISAFKNAVIEHFKKEHSLDVVIGSKTGTIFVPSDRIAEKKRRGLTGTQNINNSRMGVIVGLKDLEGSSVNYRLVDTVEEFDRGAF